MKKQILSLVSMILFMSFAANAQETGCLKEVSPISCEAFQYLDINEYSANCQAKIQIQKSDSIEIYTIGGEGQAQSKEGQDLRRRFGLEFGIRADVANRATKAALAHLYRSGFWPKVKDLPKCEDFKDLHKKVYTKVDPKRSELVVVDGWNADQEVEFTKIDLNHGSTSQKDDSTSEVTIQPARSSGVN